MKRIDLTVWTQPEYKGLLALMALSTVCGSVWQFAQLPVLSLVTCDILLLCNISTKALTILAKVYCKSVVIVNYNLTKKII